MSADQAARFLKLFPGSERCHNVGAQHVIPGPATLEAWQHHLDGVAPLAINPVMNGLCRWGAILIAPSPGDIPRKIGALKLPLVSYGVPEGIILQLRADDWVPRLKFHKTLRRMAGLLGHPNAEVCPQRSGGDGGVLMPYFCANAKKLRLVASGKPEIIDKISDRKGDFFFIEFTLKHYGTVTIPAEHLANFEMFRMHCANQLGVQFAPLTSDEWATILHGRPSRFWGKEDFMKFVAEAKEGTSDGRPAADDR